MMQFQDHYAALGVEFGATVAELDAAWLAAAERWDSSRDASPEAQQRLRDARDAWETLRDPESRAEYDQAYVYMRQETEARSQSRPATARQSGVGRGSPGGEPRRRRGNLGMVAAGVAALAVGAIGIGIFALVMWTGSGDSEDAAPAETSVLVAPTATSSPTSRAARDGVGSRTATVTNTPWPTPTFTPPTASPTRRPTSTPTVTPTRRPTSTPSPTRRPSPTPIWGNRGFAGNSLVLRTDRDGNITCSASPIASTFYHGRVVFDFVVPAADAWSVGVLYHRGSVSPSDEDSASFVSRYSDGAFQAEHWTRASYPTNIDHQLAEDISQSRFNLYQGETVRFELLNDLDGTTIRVGGQEVLRVPASQLRPSLSGIWPCVGFWSDEDEIYSSEIKDYRVGWVSSKAEILATGTLTAELFGSPLPIPTQSPFSFAVPTIEIVPPTFELVVPTFEIVRPTFELVLPTWQPRLEPLILPTLEPEPFFDPERLTEISKLIEFVDSLTIYPAGEGPRSPTSTPVPVADSIGPRSFTIDREIGAYLGCPADGIISIDALHADVSFDFTVPSVANWSIGAVYHFTTSGTSDSVSYISRQLDALVAVEHWTRRDDDFLADTSDVLFDQIPDYVPGARFHFRLTVDHHGSRVFIDGTQVSHLPIDELRPKNGRMQICAGFLQNEEQPYSIQITNLRATWTGSPNRNLSPTPTPSPTPTR